MRQRVVLRLQMLAGAAAGLACSVVMSYLTVGPLPPGVWVLIGIVTVALASAPLKEPAAEPLEEPAAEPLEEPAAEPQSPRAPGCSHGTRHDVVIKINGEPHTIAWICADCGKQIVSVVWMVHGHGARPAWRRPVY